MKISSILVLAVSSTLALAQEWVNVSSSNFQKDSQGQAAVAYCHKYSEATGIQWGVLTANQAPIILSNVRNPQKKQLKEGVQYKFDLNLRTRQGAALKANCVITSNNAAGSLLMESGQVSRPNNANGFVMWSAMVENGTRQMMYAIP